MIRNYWGPTIRVLWLSVCASLVVAAQSPETLARTLRTKPSVAVRASLAQYAKAHPKDQNGAVALLALAVNDIEAKTPERAIPTLRSLDKRLPAIAPYANLFLAQAYFDSQQYAEAAKVAATVQQQPLLTRALAIATKSSIQIGAAENAIKLLRSRYSLLDQPLGEHLLAQALEAAGDTQAAGLGYRSVYSKYPKSDQAEEAGKALQRLQISLNAAERYERGQKLLDAGNGALAKTELQAALPELTGQDRELARVRIGAAQYLARDSQGALRYLRELKVTSPEADAERLYYAISAARRGKEYAAMEALAKEFSNKYKDSRWRVEAFTTIGNQFLVDDEMDQALKYFAMCADSTSDSSQISYCQWKIAFAAYRDRRADAFQQLSKLVEISPSAPQTSAALYFMGRLSETKDPTAAKSFYLRISENFPNHYYAVLARTRLQEPSLRKVVAQPAFSTLAFPKAAPESFEIDPETKVRIDRARLLSIAGLDDYAERELRYHGRQGGPAHVVAMSLAELATRQGQYDRGVRFIKGIFPSYLYVPLDRAPIDFWKLAYPMPFREDLEKYSRSQGLDPYLVAGLIRQESEFNPKAVSRVKAQGLMQVMPSTGRELARKLGIKPYSVARLQEPKVSLQMGTYHFKNWLDAENGQIEVTLAAYNAGKSRADRWLAKGKYSEPAEFVECIPFTETREYVQAVIRNADLYRRLYGVTSRNVSVSSN